MPPSVSVLVPTYRREDVLPGCLQALREQDRKPDQIVVVCRPDDHESRAVAQDFPECQVVPVVEPGLVKALAAGAAAAESDVVVITDDDARGRRDWLARLAAHYEDASVGAVGGRDVVHHEWGIESTVSGPVGVVTPYGRMVGRHHLGSGKARPVHFLKGVNSSYRRHLLRFPAGLRGRGIVAADMASSLAVHAGGHVVVYDPEALVDHYPGRRYEADARVRVGEKRALEAITDGAYNETYVLASLLPGRASARLAYCLLYGDRATVGLARNLAARVRSEHDLVGHGRATARAVLEAVRDARLRPLRMTLKP